MEQPRARGAVWCIAALGGLLMLPACRPGGEERAGATAAGQQTGVSADAVATGNGMGGGVPADGGAAMGPTSEGDRVVKSEAEWEKALDPLAFRVLREKGTERPYTGEFWNTPASGGEYRCAGCGNVLFRGTDKFISHCGWPAFDKAIKGSIEYHVDRSYGMLRTEVTCARCDGHLGHVFEDGPDETTGVRYCINSVSITYHPDGSGSAEKPTEAIVDPQR